MSSSRLSEQLLLVAKARIGDKAVRNEASLRRATSDLYYVAFHTICEALVEPMFRAGPANKAFVETYTKLYRQLNHGYAERRCKAVAQGGEFSAEIARFAKLFIELKNKRESADYDPLDKFAVSIVRNDLEKVESRLQAFWKADSAERAAFACFVGLRWTKDHQEIG
ncbi:hypothetical protein [Frigidibacter sp. SD6-1]|uniref:hypothetical protein n=1 Tax=Frigidibacter sp. SD6-1 TaxID=3032581 RepID=UPI0024DF8911|nr:hypothetical protein [Frigidibacter sp. SD6-1]